MIRTPKEDGDNFPSWSLIVDGMFSLKSAYAHILSSHVEYRDANHISKKVWGWLGPHRFQSFLWKLAHGCLFTNYERKHTKNTNDDTCPRCQEMEETIMHFYYELLRDCNDIYDLWYSVLPEDEWGRFFSLGLYAWSDRYLSKDFRKAMLVTMQFFWCHGLVHIERS